MFKIYIGDISMDLKAVIYKYIKSRPKYFPDDDHIIIKNELLDDKEFFGSHGLDMEIIK
jgi:hypothetical protein